MSYCYDFIKKFKKEGNFCGLDKSEVSRLEAYIEIMKTLETHDLNEKFIVEMFPLGAARVIIPLKDERRTEGLCYVTEQLLAKKHVTAKSLAEKLEISNNKPKREPEKAKESQTKESGKPLNGLGTVPPGHPNHGVGCAQPGSVVVTDAPPIQPLSKVMEPATTNEKLKPTNLVDAPASEFKTGTQVKNGIVGEMYPEWSPDVCKSGKCPDGNDHRIKGEVLGDKCNLSGSFIRDQKLCPIIERKKRAEAGGFVTGTGKPFPQPITAELRPIKIVKTPLTEEERKALADAFVERAGRTANEIRQIDELVTAQYERCKTRFELIDKALQWFLAQAEGE